ncbi:MAG TPA: hypothetical protein VFW07_21045 [Parafilimonas sp.]|nr:hypothetical protein [Parafilimonas sp.]
MKTSQASLDKLQQILADSDYIIRYERGTFQSGWCLLEQKRIVVLNKFLDTEGRINTLLDLIPQVDINFDKLTLESQKVYTEITRKERQSTIAF